MKIEFLMPYNLMEYPYFKKISEYLLSYNDKIMDDLIVYFCAAENITNLPQYGNNVISIITGDEYGRIPSYIDNILLTFKTGATDQNIKEYPKLIPFPWGYSKQLIEQPLIHINDRNIDVFYSGQMITKNRYDMIVEINKIKNKPFFRDKNIDITVTGGFGQGDNLLYSKKIVNSKIALCPAGTNVPESYRFFEALKNGCTVICDNLPNNYIYNNNTIIRLGSWINLENVLMDLLKDKQILNNKFFDNLHYYETQLSEKAMSEFIYLKIKEKRLI